MTADAESSVCAYGTSPTSPLKILENESGASHNSNEIPPLPNKWLENSADDRLYHFGISKSDTTTISKFKQVKYVCTGGSAGRIKKFAEIFALNSKLPSSGNLSSTDRFVMYLTGHVLWINHGMGVPSLSIMLVEVIKLLHYARATDVKFIRMGTSGGVGVEPGTLIVSSGAMNGLFQQKHIQYVCGKTIEHDAILDASLGARLFEVARRLEIPTERGITLCADDFYEGQMRLDGLFCDFRQEDKTEFLEKLYALGVRNIEMESTGFAAFTHRAKIPAAVVCVAIVNRMVGDQVLLDKNIYQDFEMRPFRVVSSLINANFDNSNNNQ